MSDLKETFGKIRQLTSISGIIVLVIFLNHFNCTDSYKKERQAAELDRIVRLRTDVQTLNIKGGARSDALMKSLARKSIIEFQNSVHNGQACKAALWKLFLSELDCANRKSPTGQESKKFYSSILRDFPEEKESYKNMISKIRQEITEKVSGVQKQNGTDNSCTDFMKPNLEYLEVLVFLNSADPEIANRLDRYEFVSLWNCKK